MKFIYLRKAAEKYAAEAERSDLFYIRNGFRPTWAERERNDRERGLKEFSTAARWEQYQSGKITRAKAFCEALNASPAVLAVLYAAEDNRLKGRETRKQPRADVLGYGSGYGVLPYFEGGCGVSCVANIFTRCGYVFEYGKSGEHFNTYYIKKGGAKE